MENFIRITPFMRVADLDGAVRVFVDVLGFKAWIHVWDYAYVQHETAAVPIMRSSTTPGEETRPGNRAFRYHIDIRDVDGFYA